MSTAKRTQDSPSEAPAGGPVFVIEILPIIREAQQQHGLRHGDYQRYRQYCTRKLERLRDSLHFAQAVRSKMQPKRVIDLPNVTDVRFFHVPLFLAERAWSFAMQLKAEANTEPRKRFHMVSRLRKAVRNANELVQLAEKYAAAVSPRSKLEIEAYAIAMRGTLAFERRSWTDAREALQLSKAIYERLGASVKSRDTPEDEAIYAQKCSELAVQARFCAYQLGDQHAALADLAELKRSAFANDEAAGATNETLRALLGRLEELVLETDAESTKRSANANDADAAELEAFRAVVFFDQPEAGRTQLVRIPVHVENVRYFLLALRDAEKQPAGVAESAGDAEGKTEDEATQRKRALDAFENTLKRAGDAAQELRDAIRATATPAATSKTSASAKKTPAATSDESTNLNALLRYVQLVKLAKTVERNQLILEGVRPSDMPFGVSFSAEPAKSSKPATNPSSSPARTGGTGSPTAGGKKKKQQADSAAEKRPEESANRQQQLQQAAKLHDSIVQSLEEMLDVLPPAADATTVAKGKSNPKSQAQGDDAATRAYERVRAQLRLLRAAHCALRYFCLAETFSGWRKPAEALFVSSFVRKHAEEALGLLDRATASADDGRLSRVGLANLLDAKRVIALRDRLTLLMRVVEVQRYLYSAQYDAAQSPSQTAPSEATAEIDTNADATLQRLATPSFIPLPAKPLFYDLAANLLTYEPVIEPIATAAQPAQQKKAGGISGLVKGWIWGSGGSAK